jgi:acyl-CoA reductase-like NAD-dependent aldehyde dehydrogenase
MRKKLFIGGKWVEAEKYTSLLSLYDEKIIAEIPVATSSDVDQAIAAAYHAREKIAKIPKYERAKILENAASLLEQRKEEAAQIIAQESAKPIRTALEEVNRTIQI